MSSIANEKLMIKMFGEFSIRRGDIVVSNGQSRTEKV